jgi:hypothetical protein
MDSFWIFITTFKSVIWYSPNDRTIIASRIWDVMEGSGRGLCKLCCFRICLKGMRKTTRDPTTEILAGIWTQALQNSKRQWLLRYHDIQCPRFKSQLVYRCFFRQICIQKDSNCQAVSYIEWPRKKSQYSGRSSYRSIYAKIVYVNLSDSERFPR